MMKTLLAIVALVWSVTCCGAVTRNIATAPMGFYVANAPLGNDANDGLTAATPKEHYCVMLQELYKYWDFQWQQPYMFVRSGQLFNEMCSTGGTFVGIDAVIIAPYDPANPSSPGNIVPSPDFVRACLPPGCGSSTPAVQWCDAFGDLAIQIYYNATWSQCNHWNMEGGAAIVLHNVATVDIFGSQSTFSGTGDKDTAILADGPAIITVANGMKVNGSFGYPLTCNRHCDATISGHMDLVGANIKGWYGMYSGSNLSLGVATSDYSSTSSVLQGPSIASGSSIINAHGTSVPGGWSQPYGGQVCPGTPPGPPFC
jgi:hypothetical protein